MQRRSSPGYTLLFALSAVVGFAFLAPGTHAEDAAPVLLSAKVIADFSAGAGDWRSRQWQEDGSATMGDLQPGILPEALGGGPCIELPVSFPTKLEVVSPAAERWTGWQALRVRLYLPPNLPQTTIITVFTKDWDHLWRQIRLPAPPQRNQLVDVTVPIAGQDAVRQWEACGHERPWNQMTPRSLLEFGVSIEPETDSTTPYEGTVLLQSVSLIQPGTTPAANMLADLRTGPRNPRVGERYEVAFTVEDEYSDPFSPESVTVTALVTTPTGTTETVRGFYYEGFLYDPQIADKTRTLTPYEKPTFKVRYCPRTTGKHTLQVTAKVEGRSAVLPPMSFVAQAPTPEFHGFLRRDPNYEKMLIWDDGTPFWGIGVNVRSPFDNRYMGVAPYSTWRNEGLAMYARLFRKYKEVGIDMVEVWMSSWWLALEWINDAPGFHGVGHYNQYRAWMLDTIVQQAEENGIGLILVFNNHGKFGALNDTEWGRNPFNKANGGFLDNCEEYFTDERARHEFRKLCDYVVARWGYSPRILAWKLFTEIDLTGTTYQFYQTPPMATWHQEMGAYLKQIDPYKHLVTTHWMLGFHRINDAVGLLPELDFLTTDAYYQGGSTAQLLAMLQGGNAFAQAKHKPLLITEYGGSPHADSMGNLIKQAHLGIWEGFFHEAPAAPMFWWFALIDDKDLYGFYTSLRHYTDNEDRRGMHPVLTQVPGTSLALNELRDTSRLFAWGFDTAYYLNDTENLRPEHHENTVVETAPLRPGDYEVEYWDVAAGRVLGTESLTVTKEQTSMVLNIPPFSLDFALKIKPAADAK